MLHDPTMMAEYVAQMAPMLVVAGAMVAWLAQIPSTTRGYGFVPDMGLGVAGSVLTGMLLWAVSAGAGMLAMFALGGVGAAVAVVAQRGLWSRPAPGRS
jgi:uncharacterized membrane protein YeaQ/YmgE (transglycosylase-associated protein family)